MSKLAISTAIALSLTASPIAPAARAATLIGDSISASYGFPDPGTFPAGNVSYTHPTFIVGSGIETQLSITDLANPATNDLINIDFSAGSITFTFLNAETRSPGTFNGPEFTVTSGTPFSALGAISITQPASDHVTASLVGGVLEINWQDQAFAQGSTVVLSFANAVPEPTTWAMMILGFLGVGFLAYRKKSTLRFV